MAREKGQKVLTVSLTGNTAESYPWRVVIEGRSWGGSPMEVKETVRDQVEPFAKQIPGAEMLYVTTRHRDTDSHRQPSAALARMQSPIGTRKHRRTAPVSTPGTHSPEGNVRRNPYPKGSKKAKLWIRERAIQGAATRCGWSPERTAAAIEQVWQGLPPLRHRGYQAINAEQEKWGARTLREMQGQYARERYRGVSTEEKREEYRKRRNRRTDVALPKRRRRVPRGLSVVEEWVDGTRILSDGSRLTPAGRHYSAEALKKMQARAAELRTRRHRNSARPSAPAATPETPTPSFTEPPVEPEAPRQEAPPQPEPRPGLLQRILGTTPRGATVGGWKEAQGDALPAHELPPLPHRSERWWNNMVRAYLVPETDAVALCKENHVTLTELNRELESRGIRPYSTRDTVSIPPERRH